MYNFVKYLPSLILRNPGFRNLKERKRLRKLSGFLVLASGIQATVND